MAQIWFATNLERHAATAVKRKRTASRNGGEHVEAEPVELDLDRTVRERNVIDPLLTVVMALVWGAFNLITTSEFRHVP